MYELEPDQPTRSATIQESEVSLPVPDPTLIVRDWKEYQIPSSRQLLLVLEIFAPKSFISQVYYSVVTTFGGAV